MSYHSDLSQLFISIIPFCPCSELASMAAVYILTSIAVAHGSRRLPYVGRNHSSSTETYILLMDISTNTLSRYIDVFITAFFLWLLPSLNYTIEMLNKNQCFKNLTILLFTYHAVVWIIFLYVLASSFIDISKTFTSMFNSTKALPTNSIAMKTTLYLIKFTFQRPHSNRTDVRHVVPLLWYHFETAWKSQDALL